jgi:hypothetical protein
MFASLGYPGRQSIRINAKGIMPPTFRLSLSAIFVQMLVAVLAMCVGGVKGQPCAPLPGGLAAWWPGEYTTGNIADGTSAVSVGGLDYAPGEVGQAFSFDGMGGHLIARAAEGLNIGRGTGMTIETWISPADVSNQHPIVEWNSGTAYGVHFYFSVGGVWGAGAGCLYANLVDIQRGSHIITSAGGLLKPNQFQHIALTYERITGLATLYLNGATVAARSLGSFIPQTSYDLLIGYRPPGFDGSPFAFGGHMDEISLYSRELTQAEVQSIYNAGRVGKCLPGAPQPPVILFQPVNRTVKVGDAVSFAVSAEGSIPLSYQWLFNRSSIAGAVGSTFTLSSVRAADAGVYSVVVSNPYGSASSEPATLVVETDGGQPPTISDIPDQATDEDTPLSLTFQITGNLAGGPLNVTASSSDQNLVPPGNITVTGVGNVRTMRILPAAGLSGSATITTAVTDSRGLVASDTFVLTVRSVDDPPIITPILDQWIPVNSTTGPISFTIGDVDTAVSSLTVAATSSNSALVPNANIAITGSGATRALSIAPIAAQMGTTIVTVSVTDGSASTTESFRLTVSDVPVRVVRVIDAVANRGSEVVVPIELSAQGNENAIGFSLSYDQAVLGFVRGTSPISGAQLNANTTQLGNGRIGFAIALPAGQVFAAGPHQVLTIAFSVSLTTPAASVALEFADQPITREIVDTTANVLTAEYQAGVVSLTAGYEADVAPRPAGSGTGKVAISDWVQVGRFAAGLDTIADGPEFQRADCAPRTSNGNLVLGNALISIADWVQAGRYAAGLDPVTPAGGPTGRGANLTSVKSASAQKMSMPLRSLKVRPSTLMNGLTNAVTIDVESPGDINAVGFSLSFDPAQLRFANVALGEASGAATVNVNTNRSGDGHIGLAVAMPAGQTLPSGVIALIHVGFVAIAAAPAQVSLTIGDEPIVREVVGDSANTLEASYGSGTATIIQAPGEANTPPTLSAIPDQTASPGALTIVGFSVGDAETPPDLLRFTVATSNPQLLPEGGIMLGGSGYNRLAALSPAVGQSGTAVVRITVTDPEGLSASLEFNFIVEADRFTTWLARFFNAAELGDLSLSGGGSDPDQDGATNKEEFLAGTDPRDAKSVLKASIRLAPVLEWKSVPNVTYRVFRSPSIGSTEWSPLPVLVTATNSVSSLVDLEATGESFYRIEIAP